MATQLLQWARDAIAEDERGWQIWMSMRTFPGGWNRHALTCAAFGFMRAQQKLPPTMNKIAPEADDAYLLAHSLCRDLRTDGPNHLIGAKLGDVDSLSRDHVNALLFVWFIEHREEHLTPATKAEAKQAELLEELSELGEGAVQDSETASPPEG